MSIQKIREDIQSLRGASVRIFGQPTILASEIDKGVIDILNVLDQLEEYEVGLTTEIYNPDTDDYEEMEFDSVEQYVDYMEDDLGCWKEVSHGNSYNWSAPVSNDFDYRILRDIATGVFYIQLMVHRFGDVRGNYTEYALLQFTYEEGFLYAVLEANDSVDLDDKYYANIDIFSDGYEVYTIDGGEYVTTIYDLEDFDASKLEEAEA